MSLAFLANVSQCVSASNFSVCITMSYFSRANNMTLVSGTCWASKCLGPEFYTPVSEHFRLEIYNLYWFRYWLKTSQGSQGPSSILLFLWNCELWWLQMWHVKLLTHRLESQLEKRGQCLQIKLNTQGFTNVTSCFIPGVTTRKLGTQMAKYLSSKVPLQDCPILELS